MSNNAELPDYEPVTPSRRARLRETESSEEWISSRSLKAQPTVAGGVDTAPSWSPVPAPAEVSSPDKPGTNEKEIREYRRLAPGHGLSYIGLFLFTAILYFRPYELIPALSSFTWMAFWSAIATLLVFIPSQLALENTLTFRPREVNLALLLCLAGLLSIPLAADSVTARNTFTEYLKVILMFVVMVNVVRTERRLKGLFFLVLVVSCLLSVWAVMDYQAGRFDIRSGRIVGRIGALFGNPNDLAMHLVSIVPIAVALFLSTRIPVTKILYAACALLMVAGIVATYSRGGFLGLICAISVLLWKLGRRHRAVVFVLMILIAVAFLFLLPGSFSTRLGELFQGNLDGSATSRRTLLIQSLKTIIYNPVFGVGMGNFHIISKGVGESHNSFTQVGAEMGLGAMVVYTMFVLWPFKRLRRIERETFTARRKPRYYYLAVGLQASLAGFVCCSLFGSVAYEYNIYYLVAYVLSLDRLYDASQSPARANSLAKAL